MSILSIICVALGSCLRYISRYATLGLALALGIGLLIPSLANWLRPALTAAVLLLLAFTLLRIDWRMLLEYRKRLLLISTILIWLLLISPLLVLVVNQYLSLPFGIFAALVLMGATPPISSAPAIMLLLGLDASLGIVIVLIATLLAPVTLPFVALELLNLELGMETIEFVFRLLLFVSASVLLAIFGQRIIGKVRLAKCAAEIDGIVTILLILFGIAIMDGMADKLSHQSEHILFIAIVAFSSNLALQVIGALLFLSAGRRVAVTTGFTSGNKNMALLLAVLPASVPEDTRLFFVVAQLPVFILPILLLPIYKALLSRN